jgi:hypothetical protein
LFENYFVGIGDDCRCLGYHVDDIGIGPVDVLLVCYSRYYIFYFETGLIKGGESFVDVLGDQIGGFKSWDQWQN